MRTGSRRKLLAFLLIAGVVGLVAVYTLADWAMSPAQPPQEVPPAPPAQPNRPPITADRSDRPKSESRPQQPPAQMPAEIPRTQPTPQEPPQTTGTRPPIADPGGWQWEQIRGIPMFPWPPPAASASYILPAQLLRGARNTKLRDTNRVLSAALSRAGYVEKSYYAVPQGFALVTRLEQIADDASPMPLPARWSLEAPRLQTFSLQNYLLALLKAPAGYYRVLLFVVTDVPFSQSSRRITGEEAVALVRAGLNVLPEFIAKLPYTPETVCTVLVYEFRRREGKPDVLVPGRFDGLTHLRRSRIWQELGGAIE
jgi:hypothetical protein